MSWAITKLTQRIKDAHVFVYAQFLIPLNNKFPNPNTQKIYNKFPNQLRKKKINPLHGCYRQCAKIKGKKKKKREREEEGLKESFMSLWNVLGKTKSRKE